MSFVAASLAPLIHLNAAPSALAIGFSVLLVASLVAAEEAEVRKARRPGG